MAEHGVVIAGGGPTGLVLAAELQLAGVDAVVVERRLTQDLDGSRAGGLHARTIEVLEQRGVAERFVSQAQMHPVFGFLGAPLDMGDLPSRHRGTLGLWQSDFERILAGWVLDELGAPIRRGVEVVGLAQDADGVGVDLSDGSTLRSQYLVGCDGGRSIVRKAAGIDFPGTDPTMSWMLAEVEMDGEPELGFHIDERGRQHALGRRQPDEPVRGVLVEDEVEHDAEPTLEDLRAKLVAVYGSDFDLRDASWITRFSDVARQAATYRSGRVLVAGDAAHIHPPMGGQGMGTGVQDAVNLGWKLAQVVRGTSPEALLDTYQAERHPVGARAIRMALAQVQRQGDARHDALRETAVELVAMDEPRRHIAGILSGIGIRYDLGDGHPLVGWRLPDLDLQTDAGATRAFALLHEARPVLLELAGSSERFALGSWSGRVRRVEATAVGPCELPGVGAVELPSAVLLRPDGHVAWAGDTDDPALPVALETWFGAA
jgi:2-polyprenyl-6-methoxyphenol hydroxylase-like FAD-dependent oxidoreductase